MRWALEAAPGPQVLDLGAGTGKLTQVLLSVGADVTAVEPDGAMRAELRRRLPGVAATTGRAEEIPLPDGSVDAVLAGHSLHWFDMSVAGPEICRVLRPGGILAGLWNVLDDRADWVAALARVSGAAVVGPRDTYTTWRAATARAYLPASGGPAVFDSPSQAEFAHSQRRSVESLVETLATRAGVLVMSASERETTLSSLRAFLLGRPETVGEFDVPMLTGVLRVTRLAGRARPD